VLGCLGDRGALLLPRVEGLAGREPGRAAAHRRRRLIAAGLLFGQKDPQDLGRLPALRSGGRDHLGCGPANVGHAQPPQQPVELVGEWWGWWRFDAHARSSICPACSAQTSSANASSRACSGRSVIADALSS